MIAEQAPEQRTAARLLAALYAWEAAVLALAMAFYRFSNRLGALTVRQHAWIVAPAAVLLASFAYIVGALGEAKAFIPEHTHYSAEGNATVARCLSSVVECEMRGR